MNEVENFENIVFLDIDGVLQNNFTGKDGFTFEKDSIDFLNMLYEQFNIQLVLSSSWRHAFSFIFMQNLLKENGIKASLIDRTYIVVSNEDKLYSLNLDDLYVFDNNNIYTRDLEILEWIKMFNPKHFLVLDDFKFNLEFLESHRIKRLSAFCEGGCVNLNDLSEAIKILKK